MSSRWLRALLLLQEDGVQFPTLTLASWLLMLAAHNDSSSFKVRSTHPAHIHIYKESTHKIK